MSSRPPFQGRESVIEMIKDLSYSPSDISVISRISLRMVYQIATEARIDMVARAKLIRLRKNLAALMREYDELLKDQGIFREGS